MTQLPKNAKRVFKGTIFDVYQWPQKMFDGSTETFEKLSRQDSVDVIATVGKKIIVLRQQQPGRPYYFSLPGGRMDKLGESPKKAIERELMEETGTKAKKLKLFRTIPGESKISHTTYVFIGQDCEKVAKPNLDAGEKIKEQLYDFEDFLKLTDRRDCHFWPADLKVELLLARIYPKRKKALYKQIFG